MNLQPHPARAPDTAAELRALYRAAEARAARLRVLADAGQALAAATPETLDSVAAALARDAAHLAGYAEGRVTAPEAMGGCASDRIVLALRAPGNTGEAVGALVLEGHCGDASAEERETLDLMCLLLGASLSARAREQRLSHLLGELLRSQEVERARIAHELHDGVAQSAAALIRRLELAEDGDPADLAQATTQARTLVKELRQVITGMRPLVLDDLGLVPALHQLAAEARDSGLAVTLHLALGDGERPAPAIETALFRVVQEAINNARAHAGDGVGATVRLERTGSGWRLEFSDDGSGFDTSARPQANTGRGLGLAYMRERIELLGGRLSVSSAPSAGCTLLAEIPAP